MPEADFYSWWKIGYAIGAVVVVAVAALLILILAVARKIEGLAALALSVAGGIKKGTAPVWALGAVNDDLERIARSVQAIDEHVAAAADVLAPADARPGGGS